MRLMTNWPRLRMRARTPVDAWIVQRQLAEICATVWPAVAGNLINGAIATAVFFSAVSSLVLGVGYASLIAIMAWRVLMSRKVNAGNLKPAQLRQLSSQVTGIALASGLFWGSLVGLLLHYGRVEHQLFLAVLGSGMMSAGTISFRTMGKAAKTYVFACAPGLLFGLMSIDSVAALASSGLLACYMLVLINNIEATAKNFELRANQERDLVKSNDTVQLLLNDFTEQGSDWLIELDDECRIVHPSARLAEAAQRPVETLEGKIFVDLLDDGPSLTELDSHFRRKRAFRHVIVSLTIDGDQHWWSISARPGGSDGIAFRGVITDITAQKTAEAKVSYMAHYDGLTSLPNRFVFGESLYHALNQDKNRAGLIYFDLDQFKGVNDTLGHAIGDKLLQHVARRLEDRLDKSDLLARLGGDEFAILVRAERLGAIDDIADLVIAAIGEPFQIDGHDVLIGVSIGISLAPEHADTVEEMHRTADLALYSAKSQGRNRAVCFEPSMDVAAQERRQLENDLRVAITNNEMRVHYQPLVHIDTGTPTAYEALVRWEHPERGIVMPDVFIGVAEENGMIVQIGEWVIRQAIEDLATWEKHIGISINLSPAQMRSPSLVSTMISALARNGVDSSRVCLEITESVLLQDSEANMDTLHKLRSLGIQIALDDFGTGYSSLNYLRSFPFDKIKIDRCFVNEIDSRDDCLAIIRSVVSLASSLGMTTIAEGVEREEQASLLRAEGCGELQGFLYSKAVPADQLTDLRKPKLRPDQRLVTLEDKRRQDAGEGLPVRRAVGQN
jgi:diguanylate cyclase (GGDEF)-like protein